jgi:hypothetical protein
MSLRDVAAGRVLLICTGLALVVALVVGGVAGGLAWRSVPFDGARSAAGERGVEGPMLQPAPQSDLTRARAAREASTRTTAWIDRDAGVARIPVETAMTLMAERGLRAAAAGSEPRR